MDSNEPARVVVAAMSSIWCFTDLMDLSFASAMHERMTRVTAQVDDIPSSFTQYQQVAAISMPEVEEEDLWLFGYG